MRLKEEVAGDIGVKKIIEANGVSTLAGVVEVKAHVWLTGMPAQILAGSVYDETLALIEVDFGDGTGWLATQAMGYAHGGTRDYNLEYQIKWSNGDEYTWPNEAPDILPIRAQGL